MLGYKNGLVLYMEGWEFPWVVAFAALAGYNNGKGGVPDEYAEERKALYS